MRNCPIFKQYFIICLLHHFHHIRFIFGAVCGQFLTRTCFSRPRRTHFRSGGSRFYSTAVAVCSNFWFWLLTTAPAFSQFYPTAPPLIQLSCSPFYTFGVASDPFHYNSQWGFSGSRFECMSGFAMCLSLPFLFLCFLWESQFSNASKYLLCHVSLLGWTISGWAAPSGIGEWRMEIDKRIWYQLSQPKLLLNIKSSGHTS